MLNVFSTSLYKNNNNNLLFFPPKPTDSEMKTISSILLHSQHIFSVSESHCMTHN